MVFSAKVEEKKLIVQWERFSNFNRLVNTMAYVQRVFIKHKPATKTLSVEEREGAQASIFRLLQREQFAEEMKSLKAEKEIPKISKILQLSPRTFVYRIYQVQSNLLIIESSSDKHKLTQSSSGTDSVKSTCQR